IGAVALDVFHEIGISNDEIEDILDNELLDGLFILSRSIGMIGHFIDQKRLGSALYRHNPKDVLYWNEPL
ncbi:ATP citrate synthase, partial [candidate division WWE3 bacterium]|nr:ATP citrate synthase [candidate division WWE3 bacterium]